MLFKRGTPCRRPISSRNAKVASRPFFRRCYIVFCVQNCPKLYAHAESRCYFGTMKTRPTPMLIICLGSCACSCRTCMCTRGRAFPIEFDQRVRLGFEEHSQTRRTHAQYCSPSQKRHVVSHDHRFEPRAAAIASRSLPHHFSCCDCAFASHSFEQNLTLRHLEHMRNAPCVVGCASG